MALLGGVIPYWLPVNHYLLYQKIDFQGFDDTPQFKAVHPLSLKKA